MAELEDVQRVQRRSVVEVIQQVQQQAMASGDSVTFVAAGRLYLKSLEINPDLASIEAQAHAYLLRSQKICSLPSSRLFRLHR